MTKNTFRMHVLSILNIYSFNVPYMIQASSLDLKSLRTSTLVSFIALVLHFNLKSEGIESDDDIETSYALLGRGILCSRSNASWSAARPQWKRI